MKKKDLPIVLCASLGALGVGPAAFAQQDDESVFEEVSVTAQKREQSIYDVPVAISAFTPETIERQGITDLTDIGKFVPNLNVTGFSAGRMRRLSAGEIVRLRLIDTTSGLDASAPFHIMPVAQFAACRSLSETGRWC